MPTMNTDETFKNLFTAGVKLVYVKWTEMALRDQSVFEKKVTP
jgi:hypothetical protein